MIAKGQSDKMASDMEVCMKQRCVIEFLHAEKIAPNDIHQRLLNVYRDQTVDVSTVRQWVAHFSSGDDVKEKSRSGWPCTAVTPRNKEHLDQLIRGNRRITTRELSAKLNIQSQARQEDNLSLATRQCQAPYQFEDRRAHCQSWVDCLTTPTV